MRTFILALAAAGCSLAGIAQAQPACCYGVYGGAEWLYLRPYNADMVFLTDKGSVSSNNGLTTVTSNVARICARPQYDSGVRVWLGYQSLCSCWGVRADYQYFDASYSARLEGETNQGESQFFVKGCPHIEYQRAAAEVTGRLTNCSCPFELTGFLGVGWAQVTRRRKVEADALTVSVEQESDIRDRAYFSGVGPRAGIDLKWQAPCWSFLALRGLIASNLLVAKSNADQFSDTLSGPVNADPTSRLLSDSQFDRCYRIVPGFEVKIGAQGSWTCGCVEITGEIGYRIETYINALGGDIPALRPDNVAVPDAEVVDASVFDGGTFNPRNDIGFGGLYLGLQVAF